MRIDRVQCDGIGHGDTRAEAARTDAFTATGARPHGPPVYARLDNPTTARFETAPARLEGTGSAVAFAGGMAALSEVLLSRASLGLRHVVAVRPLYGCSGLEDVEGLWRDLSAALSARPAAAPGAEPVPAGPRTGRPAVR